MINYCFLSTRPVFFSASSFLFSFLVYFHCTSRAQLDLSPMLLMFKISAASPASCIAAEGSVLLPFVAPDIWDVKLFNEEARASLLISSVVPPRCAGCMNTKWMAEAKRTKKEKVFFLQYYHMGIFNLNVYTLRKYWVEIGINVTSAGLKVAAQLWMYSCNIVCIYLLAAVLHSYIFSLNT